MASTPLCSTAAESQIAADCANHCNVRLERCSVWAAHTRRSGHAGCTWVVAGRTAIASSASKALLPRKEQLNNVNISGTQCETKGDVDTLQGYLARTGSRLQDKDKIRNSSYKEIALHNPQGLNTEWPPVHSPKTNSTLAYPCKQQVVSHVPTVIISWVGLNTTFFNAAEPGASHFQFF